MIYRSVLRTMVCNASATVFSITTKPSWYRAEEDVRLDIEDVSGKPSGGEVNASV